MIFRTNLIVANPSKHLRSCQLTGVLARKAILYLMHLWKDISNWLMLFTGSLATKAAKTQDQRLRKEYLLYLGVILSQRVDESPTPLN